MYFLEFETIDDRIVHLETADISRIVACPKHLTIVTYNEGALYHVKLHGKTPNNAARIILKELGAIEINVSNLLKINNSKDKKVNKAKADRPKIVPSRSKRKK